MFGNALFFPFLALFLHNVLAVGYLAIGALFLLVGGIQVPFSLVGGLFADRFGRRAMILLGLAAEAATVFGVAYAFAIRSLVGVLLAAAVGGSVASVAGPAASAYVADFVAGSDRTLGYTWLRIGFNAGFAAGVSTGGVLIGVLGFTGSVVVGGAIISAGVIAMAILLEPSPYDLRVAASRRSLRPATADGPEPRTPSPPVGSSTAAPAPRSFRQSLAVLAKDRVFLEVIVAFAAAGLLAGQWVVTVPLFVQNFLGVPYGLLGIGLALNGLVVVFGQNLTTRAVLGRRHTSIAVGGVGLYALAFVLLAVAGEWRLLPVELFFGAIVVLTFGENLLAVPMTTLPSNMAPTSEVGAYNGAFQMVTSLGGLVAILYGGWALALSGDPLLIWLLLIAPIVPSIALLRHAAGRISSEANRA